MKTLSDFIKELEGLKKQYGDLPVVTRDSVYGESLHNNDSSAVFREKHAFDSSDEDYHDCIVIL